MLRWLWINIRGKFVYKSKQGGKHIRYVNLILNGFMYKSVEYNIWVLTILLGLKMLFEFLLIKRYICLSLAVVITMEVLIKSIKYLSCIVAPDYIVWDANYQVRKSTDFTDIWLILYSLVGCAFPFIQEDGHLIRFLCHLGSFNWHVIYTLAFFRYSSYNFFDIG